MEAARGARAAEASRTGRKDLAEGERHLADFAATRRGAEGFVEPVTSVTAATLLLVAHDGEWTRRRVANTKAARAVAYRLRIRVYDAGVVGYPQRTPAHARLGPATRPNATRSSPAPALCPQSPEGLKIGPSGD